MISPHALLTPHLYAPLTSLNATSVWRGRGGRPANILIGPPPRYIAKVSDFGESRQLKGADGGLLTTVGEMTMVGTYAATACPHALPLPATRQTKHTLA